MANNLLDCYIASLCIIILPFTAYDITFVDNTPEQCTIRNKQITGGNAKYSPSGDQIINNQGGKKLLQVKFSHLRMYVHV